MNRTRFLPPTPDPRSLQNLFTQPPPNFNISVVSTESEYKLPQNIPSLLSINAFPNMQKKSFCKTCQLWTIEPYELHVNSEKHILNKTKEKSDSNDNDDHFSANVTSSNNINNTSNNLPIQPAVRYNEPSYDNIYVSPMYIPKKAIKRNYNPNEQPKPIPQNIANKFNENSNSDDSTRIIQNRRLKTNVLQQNHLNSYEPNFHVADSQNFNNMTQSNYDEALHVAEISIKNKTLVTSNLGREMLLPISGVFCTLCEEFFRNTDADETIHCESPKHLAAYEKLHGQLKELSDTKSLHDCNDNSPLIKRSKDSSSSSKSSGTLSYSPVTRDVIAKTDNVSNGISVASTHTTVESDLNSYSEFQGPDFSLDFPEETEDYDE